MSELAVKLVKRFLFVSDCEPSIADQQWLIRNIADALDVAAEERQRKYVDVTPTAPASDLQRRPQRP